MPKLASSVRSARGYLKLELDLQRADPELEPSHGAIDQAGRVD